MPRREGDPPENRVDGDLAGAGPVPPFGQVRGDDLRPADRPGLPVDAQAAARAVVVLQPAPEAKARNRGRNVQIAGWAGARRAGHGADAKLLVAAEHVEGVVIVVVDAQGRRVLGVIVHQAPHGHRHRVAAAGFPQPRC